MHVPVGIISYIPSELVVCNTRREMNLEPGCFPSSASGLYAAATEIHAANVTTMKQLLTRCRRGSLFAISIGISKKEEKERKKERKWRRLPWILEMGLEADDGRAYYVQHDLPTPRLADATPGCYLDRLF